jgi:hypothetical protein
MRLLAIGALLVVAAVAGASAKGPVITNKVRRQKASNQCSPSSVTGGGAADLFLLPLLLSSPGSPFHCLQTRLHVLACAIAALLPIASLPLRPIAPLSSDTGVL